jgi:hypothetical protein
VRVVPVEARRVYWFCIDAEGNFDQVTEGEGWALVEDTTARPPASGYDASG